MVAGDISTTTNEEGYFVLSQVPEGEVLVEFTASGRAPTYRVVSVSEGSSIHLPDVVLVSIYVGVYEGGPGKGDAK